ncbi:MAG: hypothetical protein ACKO0W_06995 [Planctomycetota bacterium]
MRFALLLASLAAALALLQRPALSEGAAPPPPSLEEGSLETEIPKSVRLAFHSSVYPAYLSWLAASGGIADTLVSFDAYLVLQLTPPHLRLQYRTLYDELKG